MIQVLGLINGSMNNLYGTPPVTIIDNSGKAPPLIYRGISRFLSSWNLEEKYGVLSLRHIVTRGRVGKQVQCFENFYDLGCIFGHSDLIY